MKKLNSISFVLVGALFCLLSPTAGAWSRHDIITRAIFSSEAKLSDRSVTVTSFKDLLKNFEVQGVKIKDAKHLNQILEIRREFEFSFKQKEKPGSSIAIGEILAGYSDEPDWGMDKELFGDDQYPNLWRPEFAMMGGKVGTPSQSFRHMYWPQFMWTMPFNTFKLPLDKIGEPMGAAPARSQMFFELATTARKQGHEYWGWRFLANAFHYIQDVAQPFHAAQTPTKKFILMPFMDEGGSGRDQFVQQMTNIVAYYHFAFEDYLGFLMAQPAGHTESDVLSGALRASGKFKGRFQGKEGNFSELTEAMTLFATDLSDRAGRTSLEFFPSIKGKYVEAKPSQIVDEGNVDWWSEVAARGRGETAVKREYFEVVTEMFAILGECVRAAALAFDSKPGAVDLK